MSYIPNQFKFRKFKFQKEYTMNFALVRLLTLKYEWVRATRSLTLFWWLAPAVLTTKKLMAYFNQKHFNFFLKNNCSKWYMSSIQDTAVYIEFPYIYLFFINMERWPSSKYSKNEGNCYLRLMTWPNVDWKICITRRNFKAHTSLPTKSIKISNGNVGVGFTTILYQAIK